MANDIDALMAKVAKESLDRIANFAVKELKQNVADAISSGSQIYKAVDRTKIKEDGDSYSVEVAIETSRLLPRRGKPGGFNHFMSLNGATAYHGVSMGNWVTSWFEYGVVPREGANYFGNQPIKARHMVQNAFETTAKQISQIVKSVTG